jgi:hypothetical protein
MRIPALCTAVSLALTFASAPLAARQQRRPSPLGRLSTRQRVALHVGLIGGLLAGGYIGSKIAGTCECDDPGMGGALIGGTIGAFGGGLLAVTLAK